MKKFCHIFSMLVAVVATLLLTVACSNLSPDFGGDAIQVSVEASETKGSVTTTSSLQVAGAFVMNAFIDGDQLDPPAGQYISSTTGNVTLHAGEWQIAGEPTWVSNVNTRFWCWYPVTVATRSVGTIGTEDESITFDYETPATNGTTDADQQKDLLFAYTKQKFTGSNKVVNVNFHHALSQIRFSVSTGDNGDGTYDKNLIIKNITLSGLKNEGTCVFSGNGLGSGTFTWSSLSGAESYGQNYNASFGSGAPSNWDSSTFTVSTDTYDLYTCKNVFFLIPQDLDADDAEITVTFETEGRTLSPITRKLVDPGNSDTAKWLPDHYYTYKLNATIVERNVVLSISLEDWSERDDKILI